MSKKIRLRIILGLAAFSCLTALLLTPLPKAAGQQSVTVNPSNTRGAAVVAATTMVLKETSEIRQLTIMRPVKSGAQSRDEIERMIIKNMNEETSPEEMRASELALKKLGLVPASFQFRPFLVKLLTEQVAGYYDPKAQQFYLADWIDLDGQKPVMSHELTHALQDQHFNLRRFEKWPKSDSDAEIAAHALIEGDASFVMMLYVERNPLRALAFLKSMTQSGGSSELMDHAPRALRESLLFPYEQGLKWVADIHKRGGWAQVSQAYTDLPQSTEQILHVEKYLAHEAPVKIDMPDLSSTLGAGWKRIDYDVNGEWSYYLILDEFLKSDADSERASAGWGGDRYAVYEGPNAGDLLLVQRTAWDTEKDAQEFFDAYARRTLRRYAGATEIAADKNGPPTRRRWHTTEGDVLLERRGQAVLVAEGVQEKSNTAALFNAMWK
ncbi:MAG: hypothetical protein QOD00_2203 [Blastocatellia bacterium]|jgi:hypothetical protein|nr:hypothetical protein [Blastocatellia bacterium]